MTWHCKMLEEEHWMFDTFRLKEVLAQYKKDFLPKHWQDEKYKWEAVK